MVIESVRMLLFFDIELFEQCVEYCFCICCVGNLVECVYCGVEVFGVEDVVGLGVGVSQGGGGVVDMGLLGGGQCEVVGCGEQVGGFVSDCGDQGVYVFVGQGRDVEVGLYFFGLNQRRRSFGLD